MRELQSIKLLMAIFLKASCLFHQTRCFFVDKIFIFLIKRIFKSRYRLRIFSQLHNWLISLFFFFLHVIQDYSYVASWQNHHVSSIFVKIIVISTYYDEMYIKIISYLKLYVFFNLHIIFDIGTLYFIRTFFSYAV